MTIPLICVDACGGPSGPGAPIARVAREILGTENVFSVYISDTKTLGLDKLVSRVQSGFQEVLTFSSVPGILRFLDTLEKFQIVHVLGKNDRLAVHCWPDFVGEEFTGRRVEVCTLDKCIPDFLTGFADPVSGKIFAKTLVKKSAGHGMIITPEEVSSANTNGLPVIEISGKTSTVPLNENDSLILSQPIDIAEDDKGKIEYRSWIINYALSCLGRYWHDNTPIDEPADDVSDFIQKFTAAHRDVLPKHYVLDFARTQSGQLVVVEVNFLGESGIAGDENAKGAVLNRLFTSLKQV